MAPLRGVFIAALWIGRIRPLDTRDFAQPQIDLPRRRFGIVGPNESIDVFAAAAVAKLLGGGALHGGSDLGPAVAHCDADSGQARQGGDEIEDAFHVGGAGEYAFGAVVHGCAEEKRNSRSRDPLGVQPRRSGRFICVPSARPSPAPFGLSLSRRARR